ncbi:MAG: hypothetical protein QMD10_09935 [Desulfitobacteriaceae bacterium]|nr:hypothetical protein [Desulfitobacteriaceae bacterium]
MNIPKVVERKILVSTKPSGLKQYLITLPKEYAEQLEEDGVDTLFIAFNRGLGAFPKIHGFTEEALITFLSKHPELMRLFSEAKAKQAETQETFQEDASK